ncbi:hypothetical protein A8F94_01675 [Bacillus sp. FJAT-27225]|uniref:PAS domain-containing protein n=1 Tax=Bacillus sp. FJAT-27225 TaxID=1743144 RepID=UPI00080C2946|nr:PAS domain-containing protein [Bacillus sp. FJAT-27225]OCA90614.1 hypothetical protein A8F94_01675 [Bacillus sp. FJAT-27225]
MPHSFLSKLNIHHLLNKIKENILIANTQYEIVWFNDSAKELLSKIGPFVGMAQPEDFIGRNLFDFHGDKQKNIIINGPFPHSAHINLFKTFSARIVVDTLEDDSGNQVGLIVTWKDVTDYEAAIIEGKQRLRELDIPIIPMSIDNVIMVPILGKLTDERLSRMEEKILAFCAQNEIEYLLLDFTGTTSEFDTEIAYRLKQLISALRLMGAEPIYIGIRPDMAKNIVHERIVLGVKTFQSYKQGINYLWTKNGYKLTKMEE